MPVSLRTVGLRIGAAVGGVVVLAAALAWIWGGERPGSSDPISQSRWAYEQGDWAAAAASAAIHLQRFPNDAEASRLMARALARAGRLEDCAAAYASLPLSSLEASDLLAFGEALAARGNRPLSRAAIESARRRDPEHRDVLRALARLDSGEPPSRAELELADRIAVLGGWEPAAALAFRLAALGREDPRLAENVLGRILQSDRGLLAKVHTAASADLLVARALLECGAPQSARRTARAVIERSDPSPEAWWLLSRAHLQLGQLESAQECLQQAQGFGQDHPERHEPALPTGAAQCRECHGAIYRKQQSSRHALTIRQDDLSSAVLPDGPLADPVNAGVVHEFRVDGPSVKVTARADGEGTFEALAEYLLGSGRHGTTFLTRDPTGQMRELRMSYYTEGPIWDLTGGFPRSPESPDEYLGRPLSAEAVVTCLHCHTTDGRSYRERTGPLAADRGIGCERCHGSGGNHVIAVERGFSDLAIGRPKLATGPARLAICGECHRATGQASPADPGFTRFHATTLPQSACYQRSLGRLDCVTCHDPHGDLELSTAYYESRCLHCHASHPSGSGAAVAAWPVGREPAAAPPCPVNSSDGCIACHMPKVRDDESHADHTDHLIRILRPPPKLSRAGSR